MSFVLAGPTGFEPAIFSVTGRRVNRATPRTLVAATLNFLGGWGGDWTHDLGLMSHTLYQLSYPALKSWRKFYWLRGVDSNHQSQGYEPCEMPFLYPAIMHLKNRSLGFHIPARTTEVIQSGGCHSKLRNRNPVANKLYLFLNKKSSR